MALKDIEKDIRNRYEIYDIRHAVAILQNDFENEWSEIKAVLNDFHLKREDILQDGGRKSPIAETIDSALYDRGWKEIEYDTQMIIKEKAKKKSSKDSVSSNGKASSKSQISILDVLQENQIESDNENVVEVKENSPRIESMPTHGFDCVKGRVALEIQWNNKDPFYDRDLRNFRNLFEKGVISVGVIITRSSELQTIFNYLGKKDSYGASTTHMRKLLDKIDSRGAGGCPLLIIGISPFGYSSNGSCLSVEEIEAQIIEHCEKNRNIKDIQADIRALFDNHSSEVKQLEVLQKKIKAHRKKLKKNLDTIAKAYKSRKNREKKLEEAAALEIANNDLNKKIQLIEEERDQLVIGLDSKFLRLINEEYVIGYNERLKLFTW